MNAETPLLKGAEHHIYVVEIVGYGVKVGITQDPTKRLQAHRRDASAYGREVGRTWVSAPHCRARFNERALVALGGPGQRREYLPLDFDTVATFAQQLPMHRADRVAVEARHAAISESLKSFVLGGKP